MRSAILMLVIIVFLHPPASAQNRLDKSPFEDASPLEPQPFKRFTDIFVFGGSSSVYKSSFSVGVRYRFGGIEIGGNFDNEKMPSYENYAIPHNDYTLYRYKRP